MTIWKECIDLIVEDHHYHLLKRIKLNPNLVTLLEDVSRFDDGETFADLGRTLLMWSAAYGSYGCTKVLIEHGADVNKRAKHEKKTALIFSVMYGKPEIARYLLDHGAELSLRDAYKKSALDFAVGTNKHEWFELFDLYKNKFDEKDLALYYEKRLPSLFV